MTESNSEKTGSHAAQEPLVSVVIPAYNSARFIGAAIESVLQQTFSSHEIIVVNDGSEDTVELEAALQPYFPRLRYFRQENRGPSAARNAGIREARGRYVAFLDSDDVWLPHHLANQITHLEDDHGVGLVYANNAQIDERGYTSNAFDRVPQERPVTLESLLAERCTVNTSTVVVLREALLEAGFFDEEMRRCEDFDLWLRLASNSLKMTYDPGVHALHRLTKGLSSNRELMKRARRDVYQKVLAKFVLTLEQIEVVASKIRELEKEIEMESAKRHLSAGMYGEALAAIERARSLGPGLRLGLAESGLRYCPRLFRWCYGCYSEALNSYRRRSRAGWKKQRTDSVKTAATPKQQVMGN